jgi:D-serine deaminase-like pyridoxal phosphate-dependent protein
VTGIAFPTVPFPPGELDWPVRLTDLLTPCVLIEQSKVSRNIERMQSAATANGRALRPHTKTHKSVAIARQQVAQGARGICCAKLGEAEVFAAAGFEDIRVAYPLNPVNIERVLALAEQTRLSFIVDHPAVAREWSDRLAMAGRTVDVLVKVDVGLHRCGIDPEDPGAADFVAQVARLPGLQLRGLLSHAGHAYGVAAPAELQGVATREGAVLRSVAARAAALGVTIEELSVGATPTARFSIDVDGVTEVRPGNYVYYDRMQVALGSASWDDCALTVLARVVSAHGSHRLILDCGSKTLSSDLVKGPGAHPGHGVIFNALNSSVPDPCLVVERLSEEHAVVRSTGVSALKPGDLVRVVPNHSCVVSNLVDDVWLVDGDTIVEKLAVSARGRIA